MSSADGLDVRVVHVHVGFAANIDELVHGIQKSLARAANVGREHGVVSRETTRECGELVGRRVHPRRVDEPDGKTESALLERSIELRRHLPARGIVGLAGGEMGGAEPQRSVRNESPDVERKAERFEVLEIAVDVAPTPSERRRCHPPVDLREKLVTVTEER